MTRRCSHCSHNGHNSRTCPNRGVKLFGVRLTDGSIRKSASMGNLSLHQNGVVGNTSPAAGDLTPDHVPPSADGYASEDFVPGSSSSRERKKAVMLFHGMTAITSDRQQADTQVCFISFIEGDTPMAAHDFLPEHPSDAQTQNNNHPLPPAPILDEVCESMASSNSTSNEVEPDLPKQEGVEPSQSSSVSTNPPPNYYPVVYPTYVSPFYPYPVPYWTGGNPEPTKETHEVVKPTAVHSKSPINVDELVGMSKLSLGETIGSGEPSSLSLKLLDGSSRQSAFHANPTPGSPDMNSSGGSPIHAV
uniref:Uncharacterized protein n=1 Tax=Chenopodium quinoa TaxID=63459 RepID=A0A803L5H5_CHEQI